HEGDLRAVRRPRRAELQLPVLGQASLRRAVGADDEQVLVVLSVAEVSLDEQRGPVRGPTLHVVRFESMRDLGYRSVRMDQIDLASVGPIRAEGDRSGRLPDPDR